MKYYEKLKINIVSAIITKMYFSDYSNNVRCNMADNRTDNYIGIDEAAEYLGIKTVTLRNWIKRDDSIPAHKIGKLWKFKRSELDVWVQSGKSAIE